MSANFELGFRRRKASLTEAYAQKAADAIDLRSGAKNSKWPRQGRHFAKSPSKYTVDFSKSQRDAKYACSFSMAKHALKICVNEPQNSHQGFYLDLWMEASVAQSLPFHSVRFEILSLDLESSLIAWKYLEHLLTEYSHKDDLIQLLGYYQYKRAFSIKAEVQPNVKACSPNWTVLEHVSRGLGVGVVIEAAKLQELYDMPSETIEDSLRQLKGIGFEIRSHRTNKQIPKDSYLIPYPFPTLNSRSLQGLTKL